MNKEGTNSNEKRFWKSLREYNEDPEIQNINGNEFPDGAADDFDLNEMSGISRRKFMALMGASAAFAATACSDYRDRGDIIPYNKKPEEITVGVPDFYASSCTICPNACGVLVKTREGRPIKIDGNPEHPVNQGKLCTLGHASIFNLYDPERIQFPLKNKNGKLGAYEWLWADREIISNLDNAKNSGKEIAIITHTVTSPAFNKLINDFRTKYPTTKIYSYEYFGDENRQQAWQSANGAAAMPRIKWEQAKIILALEGDFLCREGSSVENARLFAQRRNFNDLNNFNRLYAVEGNMSVTGMNADIRLRLNPAKQLDFVNALISEVKGGAAPLSGQSALASFAKDNNLDTTKLTKLVSDLSSNRDAAIVYAGNILPASVHAAVNQLNDALGATALYDTSAPSVQYINHATVSDIDTLVGNMRAGNVAVVVHVGTNPVFHFPPDFGYNDAIKKVPCVVSLSEMKNETSELSHYVLPESHFLESWGDHSTRAGIISLQQPVIKSLYYTRQKEAVLLNWLNGSPENYKENNYFMYIQNFWQNQVYPASGSAADFKTFWAASLHDGVAKATLNPAGQAASPAVAGTAVAAATIQTQAPITQPAQPVTGFTVIFNKSYSMGDGRFANNGWMQELPHPVSKIVWDNYAAISYKDSKELGLEDGSMTEINIGGRKINMPVIVKAGLADKVIAIELGYGRTHAGTIGSGVGFDANILLSKNGGISRWIYTGASIRKIPGSYPLATTHEHYDLKNSLTKGQLEKRKIIQGAAIADYKTNPEMFKEPNKWPENMYPEHEYREVKWGMAIDMNKCIGCGECVIGCMVENNIPVVGKEQVSRGREMQWIRVDRYYSGSIEEPEVALQTMLCQHCDNAPCEPVCPVVATSHSIDGLNQMVYNRCVGTRYCSNNCPYKVRRFNYFDFRDHLKDGYYKKDSAILVNNPEVTVRSRGVMEKCTFCVQRIAYARQEAVKDGRRVKGTDVTTACQDACPTNAIVFGDLNDPNSEVSKLRDHNLGYHIFYEFNFRPNVTYMAKLKNI